MCLIFYLKVIHVVLRDYKHGFNFIKRYLKLIRLQSKGYKRPYIVLGKKFRLSIYKLRKFWKQLIKIIW